MNIVNKLTLRHLKENKGRSIVTTLGICVSVAMITAVFVAVASFLNFYGEIGLVNNGNYHFQVTDSKEKIEEVLDNHKDEIESVGYSVSLDDNYSGYKIPNGTVMRYSVGSWIVGDEQYFKQFVTCDYDGELPKNENEIMVEQDVIEKNGLDWKIGDTVEIDTGSRTNSNGDGLFTMPVKGLYNFGEKFEKTETKSYKIVGILHNNIPTLYTGKILRGMAQDETENVTASIILNNVNINTIKEINAIVDEFNFPKDLKPFCVNVNNDYLETKFAIDPENSSLMTLLPMCLILLAIIMAASVALIYNAFSMSYAEKVRYLGMLSSVGATRRQKKKSVYFEGFVLGAIGIPVGFGAGVLGIGITLKAISGELLKSGMINSQDSVDFKVVVPLYAVVCTLVLSIVTIFISVFKPARKASAIMPIDAIRQTNEIKLKKKIKTPFFIRKIFGYEGELAHKNLKRNGRKSRVITASIAVSVILFLSCNYFCDMFVRYNALNDNNPMQVTAGVSSKNSDELEEFLSENSYVDDYFFYQTTFFSKSFNDNSSDAEIDEIVLVNFDFFNDQTVNKKYSKIIDTDIVFYFNGVEDDDFDKLCEFSGIDSSKYYELGENGEINCLVMNNLSHKTGEEGVFNEKITGNSIYQYMCDKDGNEIKDTIYQQYVFGELAKYDENNYICSLNPSSSISCYYPRSAYEKYIEYCDSNFGDSDYYLEYGIVTDEHEKVAEEIGDFFEQNNYENCSYSDYEAMMQTMNSTIFILQVLIYGFISLITLITIFNIINTISTSIALRKKEFAMLKSVGTTPKGFNKMIVLESAFYGIKALIFSLPISILVNYGINRALGEASIPFEINWLMILAVIVAVFLIVGITMIYSVHKLKDDSIVETLKEDIS